MAKHILVIDNEEAVRKSFSLALEDTEYEIDTAESGAKGLQLKEEGQYDLIFLDLKMPGMSGVEVLREIRGTDRDVPVYIVTAFHKEYFDELKTAEKEGIRFQLFKKPIAADRIVLLTKSVLERSIEY